MFALALAVLFAVQLNAQAPSAERQAIYKEMEATLGLVPTFMKHVPDNSLRLEWELMKQVQMAPGAVPNKYRELIGVAISSVTKCKYCSYFHTQFAKLNGATDAEIEDAIHYAKSTAGWSTYINGYQEDYDQFCKEVDQICAHVRSAQAATDGK
jgi:AhpD family alkylhydroperoxidase